MKRLMTLLAMITVVLASALGQDVTGVIPEAGNPFWEWLKMNWYFIVLGLYETVARVAPTSKSYSILTIIMKVITVVFPNRVSKNTNTEDGKQMGKFEDIKLGKFGQ